MTPDPRGPVPITRKGDDFFRLARPACESDCLYLEIGQTDWRGPFSLCEDWGPTFRAEARWAKKLAEQMTKDGMHLHTQVVGLYIRTRRLPEGPVNKLSDWYQLPAGVPMLVNPYPTADDIEKALTRVRYMRNKGCGRFRSWTDESGALWAERL